MRIVFQGATDGDAKLCSIEFTEIGRGGQPAKCGKLLGDSFTKGPRFLAALWLQFAGGGANRLEGGRGTPAYSLYETIRVAGKRQPLKWPEQLLGRPHAEIVPNLLKRAGGTVGGKYSVALDDAWNGFELTLEYSHQNEISPQPPELFLAAAKFLLNGPPEPEWKTDLPCARPGGEVAALHLPDPTLPLFDSLFPRGQRGQWQRELEALVRALHRRQWETNPGQLPFPRGASADLGREASLVRVLAPKGDRSGLATLNPTDLVRSAGPAEVILVSPREWSADDRERHRVLSQNTRTRWHLLGRRELEALLRAQPHLLARYYPKDAARAHPTEGFAGKDREFLRESFLAQLRRHPPEVRLIGGYPTHKVDHLKSKALPLGRIFVPPGFHPESAPVKDPGPAASLAQLVTAARCAVFLGDPGAGKTTLLHYAGLVWSGVEKLAKTNTAPRLPLFLALRDFTADRRKAAEHDKPLPSLLEALIRRAQNQAHLPPKDAHPWFFQGLLEMGEAVVLLDGLDEAGDAAQRRDLARLIEEFQEEFPDAPVWVTSRVVGYDDGRLSTEVFTHYRVNPFTPAERDQFIHKWYLLQGGKPAAAAGESTAVGSLIAALDSPQTHEDVRNMAGNPLLLSLMALIHYTGGELPQKRGELYQECVRTLVDRWERVKSDDQNSVLKKLSLTADRAESYLASVAFAAQTADAARGETEADSLGNIPEDSACAQILPLRQKDRNDDSEHAAREDVHLFLKYVRERAGLLIWRGARVYAFGHRSFQEYLAAYQQANQRRLGWSEQRAFFFDRVGNSIWRETLLLFLFQFNRSTDDACFLDELADEAAKRNVAGDADAVWNTLALAVRDELRASPRVKQLILKNLVTAWAARADFEHEAVKTLADLIRFAPAQVVHLREVLADLWNAPATPLPLALAALHLRVRLLGWPPDATEESGRLAEELRQRLEASVSGNESLAAFCRAGELLGEAGADTASAPPERKRCVGVVRQRLEVMMVYGPSTAKERAHAGRALGQLGDRREGVGLDENGLPKFHWVEISGGPFRMGGKESYQGGQEFGCQLIAKPYRVSRYPVTVRQFQTFVEAGGYGEPDLAAAQPPWWTDTGWAWRNGRWNTSQWPDWAKEQYAKQTFPILGPLDFGAAFQTPNHPRVGVSWFEAVAFCRWLNKKSGLAPDSLRLPSEAEWERAARGPKGRAWPWKADDSDLAKRCNCQKSGIGHTSAAGLFPNGDTPPEVGNSCGIADLAGNVWEWCRTQWLEGYEDYDNKVSDDLEGDFARVVRGGSWLNGDHVNLSPLSRDRVDPGSRDFSVGFRLVWVGGSVG